MPSIHLTNFIPSPVNKLYSLSQSIAIHEMHCKNLNEHFKGVAGGDKLQNGDSFTMSFTAGGKTLVSTFRVITTEEPKAIIAEQIKGSFSHFRHEQYFKEIENGSIIIDKIDFGYPSNIFHRLLTGLFLKKRILNIFTERINLINKKSISEIRE